MDFKSVHHILSKIQEDKEVAVLSCKSLCEDFIDEVILGMIFEVHRNAKLGLDFLDEIDVEEEAKHRIVDEIGLDVFGQSQTKKQLECICPNCQRSLAASRFAPHLEKCMGMGRNSSRIASRRIANNSIPSYITTVSDEDDDDDWTFNSEKKGNNKRKREKHSPRKGKFSKLRNGDKSNGTNINFDELMTNFELLNKDDKRNILQHICGVVSEHTGRHCTRSLRCPQHTEEQKHMVRLTVLGEEMEVPNIDADYECDMQNFDSFDNYLSILPNSTMHKEKLKITVKKTFNLY